MRIRGQGRFNKSINIYRANLSRNYFNNRFNKTTADAVAKHPLVKRLSSFQLVSFSCKGSYSDQLLSILSFIKNVGIPEKWIIISDGTYGDEEIAGFNRFSFIEVIENPLHLVSEDLIAQCNTWQEKKFYCYSSIKIEMTTVFLDSDILFFPGFGRNVFDSIKKGNWYLADLTPHFDPYYLNNYNDYKHEMNFTNSGFFILNGAIDWLHGQEYLMELRENIIDLNHFSEQTAMEIVFKGNSLHFLDPRFFSISLEDHFTFNSTVSYSDLAMRHFMGPIRFRMWLVAKEFDYFL